MPARVHALLVVRPDGRTPADVHLTRTLAALAAQTRRIDVLTLVLCGPDARVRAVAAGSGAEGIIEAEPATSYAEAVRLATHRLDGDAVWLLAQDTAPESEALARLTAALEAAPSVSFAAPKLVRWDDAGRIVSFGVSVTRAGRAVELVDGELDQGQHDAAEDVLGGDVRGLLVRADVWRALGGLDTALAGADEGLDLGIRARLAGGRVVLTPGAVVAVAGDGVAGPRRGEGMPTALRRAYAERTAQLHRRLAYAPAPAVPVHWISLLPLAAGRSVAHLLAKRPLSIGSEWAAAIVAMMRIAAVARARTRIRRSRTVSWARIAPLRVSAAQLRHRLDDGGRTLPARDELHFFSGGGAWVVLAALVGSIAMFVSLLAWPALGGGALAPLRATVGQLWADAAYGQRPLGWDTTGPADPFSIVVALVGSLSPFEPSRAVVLLWVLALPLAALGGWFAATRVSARSGLRAAAAIGWALAPALLGALVEGRPTGVLVHLLLPWLLYAAAVAHRSWSAAAIASLLLAAVVACAPSLAPAAAAVWALGVLLTLAVRRGRGLVRVLWLVVPTAVVFAPLVWRRLAAGDPWALFADPGVPVGGSPAAGDLLSRLALAAGFPTADVGGWGGLLGDGAAVWWVPLFVAPVVVLAVLAPLTPRLAPAAVLLLTAAAGASTALLGVGFAVAAVGDQSVALWPGTALSVGWAGLWGAALLSLDALPGIRPARAVVTVVAVAALAVVAVPAVTSFARGASVLTNGPTSTLPAYVQAEGAAGAGTIVLTAQQSGGVATTVVWGESATLGGQTTLIATRTEATDADLQTARVTADLVTSASGDVVTRLAAHGIAFVLVASPPADETTAARTLRLAAETALDQRNDLEGVGDTGKGRLWRVGGDIAPRTASAEVAAIAGNLAGLQLAVVAVTLLLAVPTRASIAAARRRPHIVGAGGRP